MPSKTYTVAGMTCEHCASAVTKEIRAIPGINGVDIDLASGSTTVSASTEPDDFAVSAAVEEAGYSLQA